MRLFYREGRSDDNWLTPRHLRPTGHGIATAKAKRVINPTLLTDTAERNSSIAFWQRILNDGALDNCDPLEKLLAGCEIIAAVDDLELLAA